MEKREKICIKREWGIFIGTIWCLAIIVFMTPVKSYAAENSLPMTVLRRCISAYVTKDGELYCWGMNTSGVLGCKSTETQYEPVLILEDVAYFTFSEESEAGMSAAAITNDGDLYCWGYNGYGQVGNGNTADQYEPVKILPDVVSVSMSDGHTAAITGNGDLYCWGSNRYGQVGSGTTTDQYKPVKVLSDVASVCVDSGNTAAITDNGDLYCWGYNGYGQIGNETTTDQYKPVKILPDVVSVSMSDMRTAAITGSGDLYCWGSNGYGQVGNGSITDQNKPVKILPDVASVCMDGERTAAIAGNGDLYCWGCYDFEGESGEGITGTGTSPQMVMDKVALVSFGVGSTAVVKENGELYCWGRNKNGECGIGFASDAYQKTPEKVLTDVSSVLWGGCSIIALKTDGSLYAWGKNSSGEAGNGTTTDVTVPTKVPIDIKIVSIDRAYNYEEFTYSNYAAVSTNGKMYCWGPNFYGQIGNGGTENQLTPYELPFVKGFVYPDDAWGFYNSDDVFGDTLNGYEIKVDDFSRLISYLTDTEMQAVVTSPSSKTDNMTGDIFFKSTLNVPVFPFHDEWGGSCYGMSNLACLIQQNIRSIEELGSSETLLKNVSFSGKVESAINFYQVQQQLPYIIEQVDDFMEKPSAEEQLKTLEELALNAQDGGTPFSIWYQWYKTDETGSKLIKNGDGNYDGYGHTVVGYGIEYSEKGFSVSCPIHSEEIYPKRILIYDCGAEKGEENYYDLYFDDEGNWYIPGRNAHSNSVEREGVLQNNAQLVLVASDEKILNAIDYKTGELSYDNSRNPEYMNISKNMRMFLSWEGGSCTIENCQVVSGEDIPILLGTGVSSEDSATQNASVILPDTSSSYTITSEEPISFTYYNGDYFEAVSSTGGGTVTVHKNGSVELDSKQETDYSIKVTANESPLPYSTMVVSGIVDGRVCAAVETDGIRITGDGIHDMSVTCSNRTDTLSIPTNISSEQNEIFIEQGENNQILANGKSVGADDDAKPSVGNNTGNVTPTKTVTKPTKTVTKPTKTTLVRVKRKGKKIKIFWKKNRTGTGYVIQYSTNKKFKKNVTRRVVKKKSVTSATYSGLKKNKTYYIRIRTYKTVSGKKYYSKWSKIRKSKKIK